MDRKKQMDRFKKWMVGWMDGKKMYRKNRMAGLTEEEKCGWLVGSGGMMDGWMDCKKRMVGWMDRIFLMMGRQHGWLNGQENKMGGWMEKKYGWLDDQKKIEEWVGWIEKEKKQFDGGLNRKK